MAKVARKMVEDAGHLIDLPVNNTAAELTTYYNYTSLRANLIGPEGETIKEIAETARVEDRNHFEALVPRIYELGGKLPENMVDFQRAVQKGPGRHGRKSPCWYSQSISIIFLKALQSVLYSVHLPQVCRL